MTYSSSSPGPVFRFVNAFVLVVFSIILISVHIGQVHTPDDTAAICTATNVPANCWKHGGHFRALDFTAPTTTISYASYDEGTLFGPDGVARPVSGTPYAVVFANGETEEHRQHWCTTQLDLSSHAKAACKIEKIPELWELSNKILSRSSWTFSGGVHIWYFVWISMWLSASFSVAMLPPVVDMIKLPLLVAWHLIGVVVSVMIFVDDYYFQLHLPMNNLLLGVTFEVLAVAAQFYWARQSQEDMEVATLQATAYAPLSKGLAGLMSLGTHSKHDIPTAEAVQESEKNYNIPTATLVQHRQHRDGRWALSFEVFNSKLQDLELLETLFVEMAITVPLLLLAVFCIGSRVNPDWVVASLFLRAFFIFMCMAICFKVMKFTADSRESNSANAAETWLVLGVFTLTLVLLSVYFILDWYYPVKEAGVLWGDAFETSIPALIYITLTALCLLLGSFLLVLVLAVFTLSWTRDTDEQIKEKLRTVQSYFFYGAQVGLLVLRTTLFAYAVDPHTWYGSWSRMDVLMNYP